MSKGRGGVGNGKDQGQGQGEQWISATCSKEKLCKRHLGRVHLRPQHGRPSPTQRPHPRQLITKHFLRQVAVGARGEQEVGDLRDTLGRGGEVSKLGLSAGSWLMSSKQQPSA